MRGAGCAAHALVAAALVALLAGVGHAARPALGLTPRLGAPLRNVAAAAPSVRPPIYACPSLGRGVALTFDDGPSEWTHTLLDVLQALNVTATFFVTGYNTNLRPEASARTCLSAPASALSSCAHPHPVLHCTLRQVVKRAFDEGHEIGIHTLTHANLTHLWVRQGPSFCCRSIHREAPSIAELI